MRIVLSSLIVAAIAFLAAVAATVIGMGAVEDAYWDGGIQ